MLEIETKKYIAFLRGINVGGNHKVPMADLKLIFTEMNFENIITILNTGNIIFTTTKSNIKDLENLINKTLEAKFGFPIPVIIREEEFINDIIKTKPFKEVEITKDTRLYVSLLKNKAENEIALPWTNDEKSYEIIQNINNTIFSVLDLSISKTIKAMKSFEEFYGKDVTTRNWNTIIKINAKL